jgi:hypothetical protein
MTDPQEGVPTVQHQYRVGDEGVCVCGRPRYSSWHLPPGHWEWGVRCLGEATVHPVESEELARSLPDRRVYRRWVTEGPWVDDIAVPEGSLRHV